MTPQIRQVDKERWQPAYYVSPTGASFDPKRLSPSFEEYVQATTAAIFNAMVSAWKETRR